MSLLENLKNAKYSVVVNVDSDGIVDKDISSIFYFLEY